MELQDIYFIAEIAGVVVVIGSLLFVGKQLSQNTRAIRITTAQTLVSDWGQSNRDIFSNSDMVSLVVQAASNPDSPLSDEDTLRMHLMSENALRQAEFNYHNWLNGDLDDRYWQQSLKGARILLAGEQGRGIWQQTKSIFSDEFQAVMDKEAETASEG